MLKGSLLRKALTKVQAVIVVVIIAVAAIVATAYYVSLSTPSPSQSPSPRPTFSPSPSPSPSPPPSGLRGEIPIGVLMPLSGDFASYGARGRACAELAESDVHNFVKEAGLPVTFKFYYEDTETKADIALEKVKTLAARGVKVVVGLMSSADVRTIKGYADANKIVIITPFSTVAELGVADDYIFRPIPHDDMEGIALAKLVYGQGYTHVAVLQRKDPCDISIGRMFEKKFKEMGGTILTYIEYEPGTSEFSAELDALESVVGPAIETYGVDKVAVQTLTWEDLAMVYTQAEARNSITLSVRWFGGDAVALSTLILRDVGPIAAKTGIIAPLYAAPDSTKKARLVEYVKEKTGEEPDIYSLIVYDCVWIAVLSVLQSGVYDGEVIQKVAPYVADNYFGVSGWTELDELGDRTGLDINFYGVVETDGKYEWKVVARYSAATGTITWVS